ncbi:hypothetical protein BVC80_441g152 [Macleaya cordata]|uniref:Uncharacterized protein n=1 Tax=Macleaya cordata TaxID=56857 RepID=A0A200Q4J1_MACCD|nr:hypothetical protein BVC80_441g152 [Macleaya cordata]
MESVSETTEVMSLNESPGGSVASTTTSNPGGEDLSRCEGNAMGKRMMAPSTYVAAILQAHHATASSMLSLYDTLLFRVAAIVRDLAEAEGLCRSAREGMKAVIANAKDISDWYRQLEEDDMEDNFETQQDVTVYPEDQMDVKISNKLPDFGSISQSTVDRISSKFPGFAALMEELSRDVGNTMGTRKAASNHDVAAILRASNVTASLMRYICDKLVSQVLAIQCDTAEAKLHNDSAHEGFEALVVDMQKIMAHEGLEAQQVVDPKDDVSLVRSFLAALLSTESSTLREVANGKRLAEINCQFSKEFLVAIRNFVRQLEVAFDFEAQQDAIDPEDQMDIV